MSLFSNCCWESSMLFDSFDHAVPYNLVILFNVGPEFFLCNVGKICAMWVGNLQQPVIIKKLTVQNKNCRKVMLFRRHCTGFFPVLCCLESLGQHCTRFLPVQCCPKSIKATLNRIFSCAMLFWSLLDNIAQGFYLCNVAPRVLRQHWTGFFLFNVVWSFLGNIAQGLTCK